MLAFLRHKRAEALLKSVAPRRIRIHSLHPVPPDSPRPDFIRIAFEFLDPPGPWSVQFYEATASQPEITGTLSPGTIARFYESEDGARTRLLTTEEGKPLRPR